ncbi:hypothetical protein Q2K19_05335 [Micromonospora soli]|uniref:hypothetical protein n=1 Tax=Micromonospora sp. NBRC 110009 TaxID=3061627 RepID=UPI002671ABE2|nr:hypothetical protein [Micromonospora sp. NBRC 110009]WKT99914.1 hypothetical protein Q2K19_05335 [Micromonospora sp. NBRC 110009]
MLDADDLLADFTAPQPYTMEAAAGALTSPGVHVVLDPARSSTSAGLGTCATASGST